MAKFVKGTSWQCAIGCSLILSTWPGCALIENPSVDELYGQESVTTPSAKAALAADVSIVPRQRDHTAAVRLPADGLVTHGALYFQDGFEKAAMNDSQFSWSIEDQYAMPLGVGRYLINLVTMPISVLVTPPGFVMISDGQSAIPTMSE